MLEFLRGKINLDIGPRNYFKRGDIIKGKVILELKEPIKARGVKVKLLAEKLVSSSDSPTWVEIYSQTIELDSEKEFQQGKHEYEFEMKIPSEIPKSSKTPSFFLSIGPFSIQPIKWKIKAFLDIPIGIDISKSKDIVIE